MRVWQGRLQLLRGSRTGARSPGWETESGRGEVGIRCPQCLPAQSWSPVSPPEEKDSTGAAEVEVEMEGGPSPGRVEGTPDERTPPRSPPGSVPGLPPWAAFQTEVVIDPSGGGFLRGTWLPREQALGKQSSPFTQRIHIAMGPGRGWGDRGRGASKRREEGLVFLRFLFLSRTRRSGE